MERRYNARDYRLFLDKSPLGSSISSLESNNAFSINSQRQDDWGLYDADAEHNISLWIVYKQVVSLQIFPPPHSCDLASIPLVGIICESRCSEVSIFSLQTEILCTGRSFNVLRHCEELTCCHAPELPAPIDILFIASREMGLRDSTTAKMSRILSSCLLL